MDRFFTHTLIYATRFDTWKYIKPNNFRTCLYFYDIILVRKKWGLDHCYVKTRSEFVTLSVWLKQKIKQMTDYAIYCVTNNYLVLAQSRSVVICKG